MKRFERMIVAGVVSYLIVEKPKLVGGLIKVAIEGYREAKKQIKEAEGRE